MKNIMLPFLTAAAISFGMPAFAVQEITKDESARQCDHKHGDKHHEGMPNAKRMLKHMSKALDLTAQQETDIKAVFEEERTKHKANMKGEHKNIMQLDPSASDYNAQVAAIAEERAAQAKAGVLERAAVQQKIHAILTPTQQQKMAELKAKRKDHRSDMDG
jgi:Spy/CpxP family protein refolding chaperone